MEGAQLGLMLAQIRNLNADADKKTAEANKTAGVDTEAQMQNIEESKQRVNKLVTEIGNNMLDATNKQLQNSYDIIRNEIQTSTKNLTIATFREQLINLQTQTSKLVEETTGLSIENGVKKTYLMHN